VCATIRQDMDWKIWFIDTLYTPFWTTGNYSAIAILHTLQFTVKHKCPQFVTLSTSRFLVTDFNIGAISLTLIAHYKYRGTIEHTVFSSQPDSQLKRTLSTLQSSANCQLPRCHLFSIMKLCYDRRSVDQSVLVSSIQLGLTTRFLLLSGSCGFVDLGRSFSRENGSAVYNFCWSSPAQSSFYCLRFQTLPVWRARSPYLYHPGTGRLSYTSRHWVLRMQWNFKLSYL
jgi:hypothetical protein